MRIEAPIVEILRQALGTVPPDAARSRPGYAEAAENLADEIYRLCIEFGVPFNDLKSTVLDAVVERGRSRGRASAPSIPDELEGFGAQLPLLIFALELMREDGVA